MNNIHFFDDQTHQELLPLTYTRPIADIRCGIFTNIERAEKLFPNAKISFLTEEYLQKKYCSNFTNDNIYINGKWLIDADSVHLINQLEFHEGIKLGEQILAFRGEKLHNISQLQEDLFQWKELETEGLLIQKMWDIFSLNGKAIDQDWSWFIKGRQSAEISPSNTVLGLTQDIFIEASAKVEASILNTNGGKIYIAENAEIMEGSMIRGSLALCKDSFLKMGTKIYGATTVGNGSKVGGELNNVVIFANSNKAHDGFLGNAVIGEWCNLGADSNNSNLKNNYEIVKLWSESKNTFEKTGLQFCGLIMGDHSKCGINTMFNTGTVIGVSCNLFGAGFPRNFVPSYSWGGVAGYTEYKLPKAFQTIEKVYERRQLKFSDVEKVILEHIYSLTQSQRNY